MAVKVKSIECPACGAPVRSETGQPVLVCAYCGCELWIEGRSSRSAVSAALPVEGQVEYSPSSYTITLVFALLFGVFGGHRFYTGHFLVGLIQLLTGGGLYLWWLIDIFSIVSGSFRDSRGRPLNHPTPPNRWPIGLAVYAVSVVAIITLTGDTNIAFLAAIFLALAAANWDKIQKRLVKKR
jgi:DNA-directed RNA polymerase subunit RPC12/RpoP